MLIVKRDRCFVARLVIIFFYKRQRGVQEWLIVSLLLVVHPAPWQQSDD